MKAEHIFRKAGNTAVVLAALLITTVTAGAQEMVADNDTGVGARSMGMGGAGIASVNNLTAVIHNPAALARIDDIEIQLGINSLKRANDTTLQSVAAGEGKVSSSTDFTGLGTLGVAYPMPTERGSLVFALAYNRVKDFEGRLKLDGFVDDTDEVLGGWKTDELIEEGGLGILSLAGAVDLSPNVSFGAAFDIWMGSYRNNKRLLFNDYEEGYEYSELILSSVDQNISAWSFKPSVLYHNRNVRFGAFLRLPMTFRIEEDYYEESDFDDSGDYYFDFNDNLDPDYPTYLYDSYYMSYKVKTPMQLGLGFSWGKPGRTNMAVDFTYENWKQAKLEYPVDFTPDPGYFRDKYRSAVSWRMGLEQPLRFLGITGRIGYLRQPLVYKGPSGSDAGASQITVENDRDYITFGIGKQFDPSFRVDAALMRGLWKEEEGNRTDEESRTRVFVSMTYRLPPIFK